jgi:hypothetical protein
LAAELQQRVAAEADALGDRRLTHETCRDCVTPCRSCMRRCACARRRRRWDAR